MIDLKDPSMKEIVDEFCQESNNLISELQGLLELLEDDATQVQLLEKFGQVIDRIMGAAKTLGAEQIATFCDLGKTIGYKSSQINDQPLLEVVVAILCDATDLLEKMVVNLSAGQGETLKNLNTQAFATRLKWLSEKFKNIERGSVAFDHDSTKVDQSEIDDLLESLGL